MRRLKKFIAVTGRERMLFIEASLLQLGVGLLLKVIPFRWIPRLFANPATVTSHTSLPSPRPSLLITDEIRRATRRAGRISPWRNRCLVQSLAVRCMLKRRKIHSELSLGVLLDPDGKMLAHAWIKSGGTELVEKRGNYTELYLF